MPSSARDFDGLEDELGDLLFLVAFYSRVAEEEGSFTIDDVVEQVHAKLIRRHPHVFGEVRARKRERSAPKLAGRQGAGARRRGQTLQRLRAGRNSPFAAVHAGGARVGHARGGGGVRVGKGG